MKKNQKVLVVDDDTDILESIALVLESEGYDVATTSKGEETFNRIKEFMPDIILLDLLLSGRDGRYICQDLKSRHDTQHIAVIMMSAHPSAKNDVNDAGADAFLPKPFDIKELLKILHSV